MKRLGTVLHVIGDSLIVRSDPKIKAAPKTNLIVFNRKMKKIGKIKEVFGPVIRPYFSIKVFKSVDSKQLGILKKDVLYV